MPTALFSDRGPSPKGPYSPAVLASGRMLFVSAQGPFDPSTGQLTASTFRDQAEQAFKNVSVLLEEAGASWSDVTKVQVFLADFADFTEMNEVYSQFVREPFPARTTVHSKIGNSLIAVDCIAVIE